MAEAVRCYHAASDLACNLLEPFYNVIVREYCMRKEHIMIIRTLAVGAFCFAILHNAYAQDYPYSHQGWVQQENDTTAYLQAQADAERLRTNARICSHVVSRHPNIDLDACMADPVGARNRAIELDNIRRDAVYRAQLREHERQMAIYARQQAEYQRELARWHAHQQAYPGYPEY